jgi:MoaA/NifB/PqqE/SkfB family radical SAM enzyme
MNQKDYIARILPKTVLYKGVRSGLIRPGNPITLTYSITAACQSRCRTCNIGLMFRKDPERNKKDLDLEEIEKIFQGLGKIYFFNISGGEPYLRDDLSEIIRLGCRYLRPRIIHIPTNALAPEKIRDLTVQCLENINAYDARVPLTVKPSIDGISRRHDEIRGVPGNFKRLEKTISYLKAVEKEYSNFHLELGTVVSNFNISRLGEIENYVHSLGIQSYRNEIAENRAEFFNADDSIMPDVETYENLMTSFAAKIRENLSGKRDLARITESLRLVYYDLAVRILKEGRQVIPCYAGISNVHINYDGEVWPCCVLGYSQPMGALREAGYDFKRIWHSDRADRVRWYIKEGNCACPLANQAYANILCSPGYLLKTMANIFQLYQKPAIGS